MIMTPLFLVCAILNRNGMEFFLLTSYASFHCSILSSIRIFTNSEPMGERFHFLSLPRPVPVRKFGNGSGLGTN